MKDIMLSVGDNDFKTEGDVRLFVQLADMIKIRKKGLELDVIPPDILECMERISKSFAWLYYKGWNIDYKNLKDQMTEDELSYYEDFKKDYSKFNDFMRTNMYLKED